MFAATYSATPSAFNSSSHRWCDADDIAELVAAGQTVYPRQLSELLADAIAVADNDAPGPLPQLQSIR